MLRGQASISVHPARFRGVRLQGPAELRRPADDPAGVRSAIEIGLYFVLCEGLLRRLAPENMSVLLLAAKFVYFPSVYIMFVLRRKATSMPRVPGGIVLFLCWGSLISLLRAPNYPLTAAFGIAVNLTFVPIALLVAGVYRTRQDLARALFRLAVFGALVGVLAMYQSTLPANHWLNRGMDLSDRTEDRVTGTFVYCTVFGNFLMGGTIASIAAVGVAAKKSTKLLLGLGWLVLMAGGLLSGSRAGILGSAIILGLATSLSKIKHKALIAIFILVSAGILEIYLPQLTGSSGRAVSVEDIGQRVQQDYFGENLGNAFGVARGIGTGWGPYTMGIWIYAERLGFNESPPSSTALEGGYLFIMAETGVVGFLLFVCMHGSFALGLQRQATPRWLGPAIGVWSLLGNIPLCLQEVPVLAIAWWFLTGLYWSTLRRRESARVLG